MSNSRSDLSLALSQIFHRFDEDHDGLLGLYDVERLSIALGLRLAKKEAAQLFRAIAGTSGHVDYGMLLLWWRKVYAELESHTVVCDGGRVPALVVAETVDLFTQINAKGRARAARSQA